MENRFNFRAYIKKLNKVYDVYCLDYSTGKLRIKCCDKGGEMIINDVRNEAFNEFFDEEEFVLMQSTGLKDKNGKEIYEGDIVNITKKFENFKDEVFYDEELCSIRLKGYSDDFCDFADWIREGFKFEVIGNIYENKELLGER